ncbi:hypothetical protein ACJX0J_025055, partial [Zea mays]
SIFTIFFNTYQKHHHTLDIITPSSRLTLESGVVTSIQYNMITMDWNNDGMYMVFLYLLVVLAHVPPRVIMGQPKSGKLETLTYGCILVELISKWIAPLKIKIFLCFNKDKKSLFILGAVVLNDLHEIYYYISLNFLYVSFVLFLPHFILVDRTDLFSLDITNLGLFNFISNSQFSWAFAIMNVQET